MDKKHTAPSEEKVEFFSPSPELVKTMGNLAYNDNRRAWGIIRLKKDILREFPQLKEERRNLIYSIIVCRKLKDLENAFLKVKKEQSVVPMLLFFGERKSEE